MQSSVLRKPCDVTFFEVSVSINVLYPFVSTGSIHFIIALQDEHFDRLIIRSLSFDETNLPELIRKSHLKKNLLVV